MTQTAELDRIRTFVRGIEERAAARVQPFRYGTAFLHEALPLVYDRNYVLVEGSPPEDELPEILAQAERIHERAGLTHRKLVFEDSAFAERVAPLLAAMTWGVKRLWIMVHRGDPPPVQGGARELRAAELERARADTMRRPPLAYSEETVRQLVENDRVIARATPERCFASFERGRVAAWCRLFSDGQVAQIEDVATLERYRRRGHSRAVVTRALWEAKCAHELVFITAEEDDWPKDWYGRLGFELAAVQWQALRTTG